MCIRDRDSTVSTHSFARTFGNGEEEEEELIQIEDINMQWSICCRCLGINERRGKLPWSMDCSNIVIVIWDSSTCVPTLNVGWPCWQFTKPWKKGYRSTAMARCGWIYARVHTCALLLMTSALFSHSCTTHSATKTKKETKKKKEKTETETERERRERRRWFRCVTNIFDKQTWQDTWRDSAASDLLSKRIFLLSVRSSACLSVFFNTNSIGLRQKNNNITRFDSFQLNLFAISRKTVDERLNIS